MAEQRTLTDEELVRLCIDAQLTEKTWNALTFERGAYDITCPTADLRRLVDLARSIE